MALRSKIEVDRSNSKTKIVEETVRFFLINLSCLALCSGTMTLFLM